MKRLLSLSIALCFLFVFSLQTITFAAPKSPTTGGTTTTPLGIDISWPQCGKKLPGDPAFVVVGVNGGLATIPNDCLANQLAYAKSKSTSAIPSQPDIQLYVNTANPGGLGTTSWPKSNTDPLNQQSPNPGTCTGSDSIACAWQYGWNRAVEDVNFWFQPAASQAGVNDVASNYIWWLDVETENTWKSGTSQFNFASNTSVLEGMTAYFDSLGAEVGLYSTKSQWDQIVGTAVTTNSNLIGLKNWRPGGANLTTAKEACGAVPLTTGGNVVMTQFISRNLDYNHSCI